MESQSAPDVERDPGTSAAPASADQHSVLQDLDRRLAAVESPAPASDPGPGAMPVESPPPASDPGAGAVAGELVSDPDPRHVPDPSLVSPEEERIAADQALVRGAIEEKQRNLRALRSLKSGLTRARDTQVKIQLGGALLSLVDDDDPQAVAVYHRVFARVVEWNRERGDQSVDELRYWLAARERRRRERARRRERDESADEGAAA